MLEVHHHRRSVHRTAIFLGVLLVLILSHLAFLLAQSQHSRPPLRVRAEGQWPAVRRSLGLPPLAAHVKASNKLPPLALRVPSRFDLKRKRALEEKEPLLGDAPPQLYFAADALLDEIIIPEELEETAAEVEELLKGTRRRGRKSTRTRIV
ncbi:hypothetical protein FB451DRAFT_1389973 [Mycena latifolia]|nr:hypothetical protein FB451DRAFT_1389973 [Mycena latifolia]